MFRIIAERFRQKYRTALYPKADPTLPARYLGVPRLRAVDCGSCTACARVCPSGAITPRPEGGPQLDMGRCLFCGACRDVCPQEAIAFSRDYRVAAFNREDLLITPEKPFSGVGTPQRDYGLYRRSLSLREVSAAGCNACEADTNVLGTLTYDLGRFGIGFAASPRHADGVLFGSSKAHRALRRELVENHRLRAVVSMPSGVFKPYSGVSTAVLVFTKTGAGGTDDVWFYDMKADGYTLDDKRAPTDENDIPDIIERFRNLDKEAERARTERSFLVPKEEIAANDYDLTVNKYKKVEYAPVEYPPTEQIIAELHELEMEITAGLAELEEML